MIKMFETPEATTIRIRELYISIHEDGISDIIKYLRLEQYHLERMILNASKRRYYNQFDLAEIIDCGDDNDLFEQTVELELRDLEHEYTDDEIGRIKAHAVVEYLESKGAEI